MLNNPIMIASVQYNDLRGTAAADVSDYVNNSLQSYLEKTFERYDGERYFCNGCKIWISGDSIDEKVFIHFICYDRADNKYVRITPNKEYRYKELFDLFKRFEVVIGVDINEIEVNENDDIIIE